MSDPTEHRYLTRIRTLLARLEAALAERNASMRFTLLGVNHTGHFQPEWLPGYPHWELVTLELPTTPVKAYLEGRGESVNIRNIFWQDLLEGFLRLPDRRFPVHGVNVNPHVRYLRGRCYYLHGHLINDFDAPHTVVDLTSPKSFPLTELGGEVAERELRPEDVLEALSPAQQEVVLANGMLHVGPRENPFGPHRHLVVIQPPPPALHALHRLAMESVREWAEAYRLGEEGRIRFCFHQLVEAFLLPINDFYLVEQWLTHAIRAALQAVPGQCLEALHVAGCAHLPFLVRYLTLRNCARISVETADDPRFPLCPAYQIPDFFAERLPEAVEAVSLRGSELRVDEEKVRELLAEYTAESADLRHRLLLKALWQPDVPRAPVHRLSFAAEEPLRWSRLAWDLLATEIDVMTLEAALAGLPLPELERINAQLAAQRRRGHAVAVAQALQDEGLGYAELRAHADWGPPMRRIETLREALLADELPTDLWRRIL